MAHSTDFKKQYCVGCLSSNKEFVIKYYKLRNRVLQRIFKADKIDLCYICRKMAAHTEHFIQTVQSNQILLEDVHNLTALEIESEKAKIQSLKSLSHVGLEIIELSGQEQTKSDVSFSVIGGYNVSEENTIKVELMEEDGEMSDLNLKHESLSAIDKCSGSGKNTAKLEWRQENGEMLDLKHDSLPVIDNCSDIEKEKSTMEWKEEDEEGLYLNIEHESFSDIDNCSGSEKDTSAVGLKEDDGEMLDLNLEEDVNDNDNEFQYIERIYLTRNECLEERIKMAEDSKYLNAMYKCKDCIKGFTFRNSYKKHMEKHSESYGDYECDICKQRVTSEERLRKHNKRIHRVRYRCSECGLVRVGRWTIKTHYSACHSRHKHPCTQCTKVFSCQLSLRKHIAFAHTHKGRVTCAYCHQSYAKNYYQRLADHMNVMHPTQVSAGEASKIHVCQECRMAFRTPGELNTHGVEHSMSRDYYCGECNKTFKSKTTLNNHLNTAQPHVKDTKLPLPCSYCDRRFAIRRDLEKHTNKVHLNIKPFQCDICQRTYLTNSTLREHIRLAHEGYKKLQRKHACSMCDKTFSRLDILKDHMRTHTGEKPYRCSKCPAQFNQASSLRTHDKLIHLKLTRDGRPKKQRPLKKQSAK